MYISEDFSAIRIAMSHDLKKQQHYHNMVYVTRLNRVCWNESVFVWRDHLERNVSCKPICSKPHGAL